MAATADPISPRLSPPQLAASASAPSTDVLTTMLPDPVTRTIEPPQLQTRANAITEMRSRTASSPVRTWTEQQRLLHGGSSGTMTGTDDRGRREAPCPNQEPLQYRYPQQEPTPPPHDDGDGSGEAHLQRPQPKSRRGSSNTKAGSADNVARLPASEIQELISSPLWLPIGPAPPSTRPSFDHGQFSQQKEAIRQSLLAQPELGASRDGSNENHLHPHSHYHNHSPAGGLGIYEGRGAEARNARNEAPRPRSPRTVSTPPTGRSKTFELPPYSAVVPRSAGPSQRPKLPTFHLHAEGDGAGVEKHANGMLPSPTIQPGLPAVPPPASAADVKGSVGSRAPSPMPPMIPLPPMSLPTHLQLELAGQRPSPLYIHHSHTSDIPYESSAVKFERLRNVLLLPAYLERTLYFGALACLDAWLHTFTILPIRFFMAIGVLVRWWAYVVCKETRWLFGFVRHGLGRLWRRGRATRGRAGSESTAGDRSRSISRASEPASAMCVDGHGEAAVGVEVTQRHSSKQHREQGPGPKSGIFRHRRTKSMPSNLSTYNKADLLQGAVILCSSFALMRLDASRMYHFIRAQSAIKLYVIFNILEVGDRLLSAIGQDILECLFSAETLSRTASGRSKVLLPAGMFVLALTYNCLHSIALYYQVITLNVAVNSYSNALLTLLLSNQFVEIKSTVFKRFEKDNLFQLTCADVVERFQLWIMLLIIAMRNMVEVGGFSVPGAGFGELDVDGTSAPLHHPSILPHSFTALPSWLWSGEVLSPFLIVVGSEMLVDTIKHAYVTKFNNIKPHFYSRTLDILCKDYYTHAFASPSLTRRLGLAVIPLSCLFIRASVQTYHMFLATYLPMPLPQSTQTSLAEESAQPSSPAMMAALNRFDTLIRDSLGRATYGQPIGEAHARPWYAWTSDDLVAALTMVVVFFIAFLVLLILKLLLGMALLKYARGRYAAMKRKEQLVARGLAERESYDAKGRRVGGRGDVEVSDDGRRWINADKTEGLQSSKSRRTGEDKKAAAADVDYNGVFRYDMVNKRIW